MPDFLRPADRQLARTIFWALVLAVFILLSGCVTIRDCHAFVDNALYVECAWCSGSGC